MVHLTYMEEREPHVTSFQCCTPMIYATFLTILPALAFAGPARRWTAGPEVGVTTSDVYPPTGSKSEG